MKYNILGYDQKTLMKKYKNYNIKGDELITLRVISDLIGIPEFENKVIDGKIFTWLKLSRIMEEIPFILTSRSTAKRRIKKLVDAGLIERKLFYTKELPNGKLLKGKFGYYAKTQLNHEIQYSKKDHRSEVSHVPKVKSEPSKSILLKREYTTKHLHDSDEIAYIYFDKLDYNDIVKEVNQELNTGRRKITADNYTKADDILGQVIANEGWNTLYSYLKEYKQDKQDSRSVENLISYIYRYNTQYYNDNER